jgi:aldehyde dehydrogenase (NAD+)
MSIQNQFNDQKDFFNSNTTRSYTFRYHMLTKLEAVIKTHQEEFETAIFKDLHKSPFELYATEVGFVLRSVREAKRGLKKWMKIAKQKTPFFQIGSKSFKMAEPLGTVLIIGPFNYPFQLVVEALIGAIAAGNTVIIKPSELTENTEKAMAKFFNAAFEPNYLFVITGGVETTQELIQLPFDHIFFTGSTKVGQIVYEAAAKNLTPVTLELGGKSPTIVDATAKLDIAARRIVYGKYLNAGQTCIAPDYIYVEKSIEAAFLEELKKAIEQFYPEQSDDLSHIVSLRHLDRLKGLIDPDKVFYTQESQGAQRMAPTVMRDVTWSDKVMQEEIFGPILPVLTFNSLDEVIHKIKSQPKPLALYLFTESQATEKRVFEELSFGGGAINDTIMHVANPHLPFGGIGASGMGKYHGKTSFDTFSHHKAFMKKTTRFDPKILYPPYDDQAVLMIKKVLK